MAELLDQSLSREQACSEPAPLCSLGHIRADSGTLIHTRIMNNSAEPSRGYMPSSAEVCTTNVTSKRKRVTGVKFVSELTHGLNHRPTW